MDATLLQQAKQLIDQGQQFRTQGSRSKTLDSTPAHAHATDNNDGRGSGANHGAQLQAAALQTREQLGQLETQLKQKAALDADTKVELFRDRKAAQARQKTLLAALVRVRETVDRPRTQGQLIEDTLANAAANDSQQRSVRGYSGGERGVGSGSASRSWAWSTGMVFVVCVNLFVLWATYHSQGLWSASVTSTAEQAATAAFADGGGDSSDVEAALAGLQRLRARAVDAGLLQPLDLAGVAPSESAMDDRACVLAEEKAYVRAAGERWELSGGGDGDDADVAPLECVEEICEVLDRLHSLEATVGFQAQLLRDTAIAVGECDYTPDNFAYGTTPFSSWHAVFQSPPLVAAVARSRAAAAAAATTDNDDGGDGGYVVMGSSIGWLVFFGALALGIPSVGFELLPSLVAAAERTKTDVAAAVGGASGGVSRARFVCGDMMRAPVGKAAVVMLASQCWDERLFRATAEKLAAELPTGAAVVDYGRKLGEAAGGTAFGAAPAAAVRAPVSWNRQQTFYVWVKT